MCHGQRQQAVETFFAPLSDQMDAFSIQALPLLFPTVPGSAASSLLYVCDFGLTLFRNGFVLLSLAHCFLIHHHLMRLQSIFSQVGALFTHIVFHALHSLYDTCSGFSFFSPLLSSFLIFPVLVQILLRVSRLLIPDLVVGTGEGSESRVVSLLVLRV